MKQCDNEGGHSLMNVRHDDGLPLFIYPELADERMINFFGIYNGEYIPEDVQALDELSNTLKELESRIFTIHSENQSSFGPLLQARNRRANELGKPWYDLSTEEMTVNDVFITICYPFFERMMGSFEARFALSGELGKYMKMYREKIKDVR